MLLKVMIIYLDNDVIKITILDHDNDIISKNNILFIYSFIITHRVLFDGL